MRSEDNAIDSMLKGAMDFLDVNDQASVQLILFENAAKHAELARHQAVLRKRSENSRAKARLQVPKDPLNNEGDAREEEVHANISALSAFELHNNMYVNMMACLKGEQIIESKHEPTKLSSQKSFFTIDKSLS